MFTTQAVLALLIAVLAGLSAMFGALVTLFVKKPSERLNCISMGFAAGVMLCVAFTDMLPEALEAFSAALPAKAGGALCTAVLLLGAFIGSRLEHIVPHKHGGEECACGHDCHEELSHVGFATMLAVALHSFPEGIATFIAAYENIGTGIGIGIATALHHIPVGISVAMTVYAASHSRAKAVRYTFLASITGPLGALIAFFALRSFSSPAVSGVLFAFISGIMLFIGLGELLPASRTKGHEPRSVISLFAGVAVMLLINAINA